MNLFAERIRRWPLSSREWGLFYRFEDGSVVRLYAGDADLIARKFRELSAQPEYLVRQFAESHRDH